MTLIEGVARLNTRYCTRCNTWLPEDNFYRYKTGRYKTYCRKCLADYERTRSHLAGKKKPINEATESASYLGVYIAETVLSTFFDNMQRMPYGNQGYDFICGKGFKIDVKTSCLVYRQNRTPKWEFCFNRNKIADYFLCLGFDNRKTLECSNCAYRDHWMEESHP